MKKDSSDRIKIRKKGKYLKVIKNIFTFFMVAVISGMISSKIVLKELNDKSINKNNYSIDEVITRGVTRASSSVVTISDAEEKLSVNKRVQGNTTGVIIDKKGYIVTSLSKVKNMSSIFVKLPALAKKPISGVLIGADKSTDVALIKISTDEIIPIAINYENIKEGTLVFAAGNSISNDYLGTVTLGAITSTNIQEDNSLYEILQTNAILNDDNIGGPLCNLEGELIGFNSSVIGSNKDNNKLYYSLSASALKKVVDDIISFTDKLGISGELIDDGESGVRGVYIENITPGGYAFKAGLLPTDIILSVDNKNILSLEDINEIIKNKSDGEVIQCEILRDGVKTNVEIQFD